MDFESTLDHVATVGYDVDFLRGEALDLLAADPIAKGEGPEHFDPRSTPPEALAATGPWAARLLQGGPTFIDELAGGRTWRGSLDLPASARQVSEMIRGWMEAEIPREASRILQAGNKFPQRATAAEQFYSLRDSIHFAEQWFPGAASSHPALTMLLAFLIGVDEFFCPVESLDTTLFLGRPLGDLWEECVVECGGGDAINWLALARDTLRTSVFLQNREKLVHVGLIVQDKQAFTDWDTTPRYMLRAEAAMVNCVGFCMCAYSGLPFRADLTGAVGIYCYLNAFVFDFCKRATRLGGGSFTEIALKDPSSELQDRSHLIGALQAYGDAVLPPIFLHVLRPFVLATSSVVDVLDRYRERSWGRRLPVGNATLWMMQAVMEAGGASLGDFPPQKCLSRHTQLASEVIEAMDAWDAYDAFTTQPSVEGLLRLPRPVRVVLQLDGAGRPQSTTASRCPIVSTNLSWLQCLCEIPSPPIPPLPKLTRGSLFSQTKRLPPVPMMATTVLERIRIRSPARPGGYAAGQREFIGRPAGAGSLPA